MREEVFSTRLSAYPTCEKCTKDMQEKLYELSEKRHVLVSGERQTTLSRTEAIEWLKSRKMSRATMFLKDYPKSTYNLPSTRAGWLRYLLRARISSNLLKSIF